MANGNREELNAARLKALLLDRQWHSVDRIVDQLKDSVPPERACRVFRSYRSKSEDYTEETQIRDGAILAIKNLIASAKGCGLIEIRGARYAARDVRLLAWHCGSCGLRMQGWDERPDHGFCAECAEHIVSKE